MALADLSETVASSERLEALIDAIAASGADADAAERRAAFARYAALPALKRPKARTWKHDLAKLDLAAAAPTQPVSAAIEQVAPPGVIICDFATARRDHRGAFEAAFGATLREASAKFAELTRAFRGPGRFIHVPRGLQIDRPIVVSSGDDRFPHTVVTVGDGAICTIVEHLLDSGEPQTVCGLTEVLAAAGARVTYAIVQNLGPASQAIATRRARCAANASVDWAVADLGGALSVDDIVATLDAGGSHCAVTGLFFATGDQHVDLSSEIRHEAGNATSDTVIKSAASDRGQGRYFGNIVILPHAHGSEATLRDDALLLSKTSHVDSVPALEIAANDVKAFHGATVGAIDEEELFYAQSRGIARIDAEKMIALGFFEPAIARFPTEELREEIRTMLAAKLGAGSS